MLNGHHHGAKHNKHNKHNKATKVKELIKDHHKKAQHKKAHHNKVMNHKKALSTMKEDDGAQEQGFSGKIVEHDDMKTKTADWRQEYGNGETETADGQKVHKPKKSSAMTQKCALSLLIGALAVASFM